MSGRVETSHSKSKVVGRSIDTAKAFVQFDGTAVDGTGGTTGVRSSFNISGVEDRGTGNYRIDYLQDLKETDNYCFVLSKVQDGHTILRDNVSYLNHNWIEIETRNAAGTLADYPVVSAIVFEK